MGYISKTYPAEIPCGIGAVDLMSIPKDIMRENMALSEWAILTGYRGSIAHGTYLGTKDIHATDDKDVMAISVPPRDYYIGLDRCGFGKKGTKEIFRGEWDIVCYEALKAIRLLMKGNPNVLMMLWLPENAYIYKSRAGEILLSNRSMFDGKHTYKSFIGYARGQLHRMTHGAHQGYMGAKRKELFRKYGYDLKNASHLIRLLRMAVEYLSLGELHVFREDASELNDIKRGRWTLKEVEREASRLFDLADKALIASHLPVGPDKEGIHYLCMDIIETAWKDRC